MMRFIQATCAGAFFVLMLVVPGVSFGQAGGPGPKLLKVEGEQATFVSYRDFGAVGDGKVDDFAALVKAHDYANEKGLPVKADEGATYYIGGANRTIVIQTHTDFGTARFIIDDTKLENPRAHVFAVRSGLKPIKLEGIASLKKGQSKIEAKLPGACVITVTNAKVKRFIRRGRNQNNGSSQMDTFLVDEHGKVDPKTPIIWDFDELTGITVQPVDRVPLTITGGKFTTIANTLESGTYHARGILIQRSNVIVEGVEHDIRGEGEHGSPYAGFISLSKCANVVVKDTVLTGHKTYRKIGSAGESVSMGSYDISLSGALNVSFVNCSQTNDIMDSRYWGIMGTNFCKNLTFDRCKLSRFDAHQGVTNATIRNSTMGYMGVRLTGTGTFLLENTTVQARHLIHLREDYGSTWRGDIIIRNCRFFPPGGGSNPSVFGGSNDGQHDFGYTSSMPARILIEKLHIEDAGKKGGQGPVLFANFNSKLTSDSYKQKHPYVITREVILKDVTTAGSRPLRLSENPYMFRNVQVEGLGQ
ncbi:hypothetical protein V2O64_18460 [Verrucomicrobiaceae bacterium 227]